MSVVAVYDDVLCSGSPIKLSMTQAFVCEVERFPEQMACTTPTTPSRVVQT
jgi:hypothetical protein